MGVFANIQRVLDERLKTTPTSPFISWPNAETRPGNSQLTQFVRPTLLLANTELNTLDGADRIPGIYQIDIYGKLNRGVGQTYSLADEIKEYFSSNRRLQQDSTAVHILGVSMGQAIREEAWFKVIVEVNFVCYHN